MQYRHIAELVLSPIFLCVLVLGICGIFLWGRVSSRMLRVAVLMVFFVLVVISTGWLPRYLTRTLESQYPVIVEVDPAIKWVVILSGGQTQGEGMPPNALLSSASIKRLTEGVRLLRTLPDAKLVLSGGSTDGEQTEAVLLAQLTGWFSIPSERVVLEQESLNTADQARELRSIVHSDPFYLVTSATHMPRAMALCREEGLNPVAAPTDFTYLWYSSSWEKMVIPNAYNLTYFSVAMHEVLGRVWGFVTRR